MAEDTMFSEAVAAARAGEVVRARDLLARLLRADSTNPDYWLWMSAVVDSERESVYCLRSVLKMRPNHTLAQLGLGIMGQISLKKESEIPLRQHRSAPMPHQAAGRINTLGEWWKVHRNRENAVIALLGFFAVIVVSTIVILQVRSTALQVPLFGGSQTVVSALSTTDTPAPTEAATFRPIPTLEETVNPSNLIPFATFIGVDFTPTTRYGITPMSVTDTQDDPLNDALDAIGEGRYEDALVYLDEVLSVDKMSAQAHYLKGEVYRLQWKMKDSLEQYELAIAIDKDYAPAYFGRALWSKQNNPDNDYDRDLDRALERDPQYVDAYIERAFFYGYRGRWEEARNDLVTANQIAPDNAFVLIRLGRAQVRTGQAELAEQNILRAQGIDPTILEGYLALGEVYDALQSYEQAVFPLVTYTTYDPEEILGWLRLGEAYTGTGQYPQALEACTHAVDLNVNSVQARLCRGKVYRLTAEYKKAVEDLRIASDRAPNMYSTQFTYGCALLEYGKPGLAIEILIHARELAVTVEETADAIGWLALAYEKYSNNAKAETLWEELLALEDVPEYWKNEAYNHLHGLVTPSPGETPTANGGVDGDENP